VGGHGNRIRSGFMRNGTTRKLTSDPSYAVLTSGCRVCLCWTMLFRSRHVRIPTESLPIHTIHTYLEVDLVLPDIGLRGPDTA
jgi:hypothetical protein